ncbi:ADP-ribosylation/Crystallin J1 [Mycena rebaudengoi]|nr:ADP-ribosylation/Crystallin J1 [Mycena rebaudengoi]
MLVTPRLCAICPCQLCDTPSTPTMSSPGLAAALYTQSVVPASAATKIRLALLATALVDALGGPCEFQRRFHFDFTTTMRPNDNFGLPPGVWTDDTSMALCLACSLATTPEGFHAGSQLDAYRAWWRRGTLSATGHCFDIGNTVSRALSVYEDARNRVGKTAGLRRLLPQTRAARNRDARKAADIALPRIADHLSSENCAGNGSLMRVLPVGLAYWRDEAAARKFARRSSETTHPNAVCVEGCEVWIGAISRVLQAATHAEGKTQLSKLDIFHYFATFPYATGALRRALAPDIPFSASEEDGGPEAMEAHYIAHHRLLRLRQSMLDERDPDAPADKPESLKVLLPTTEALPSTGYVLDTLVAALYAFMVTQTFEDGAILIVNMGSDADTTGAVYAGLAGCWYASDERTDGAFWSPRVREWRDKLVKRKVVEGVAKQLVTFNHRQSYSDS